MAFMSEYMEDESDDAKREVVALLCGSTINDGDHLQVSRFSRRTDYEL